MINEAAPGYVLIRIAEIKAGLGFSDFQNPNLAFSVWGEVVSVGRAPRKGKRKWGIEKGHFDANYMEDCDGIKVGDTVAYNYRYHLDDPVHGTYKICDCIVVPQNQVYLKQVDGAIQGCGTWQPFYHHSGDFNSGGLDIRRTNKDAWSFGTIYGKECMIMPQMAYLVNNPFDGSQDLFAVNKDNIATWILENADGIRQKKLIRLFGKCIQSFKNTLRFR